MTLRILLSLGALLLAAAVACYARGILALRQHPQGRRRSRWQPAALVLAVVIVVVIGASPLAELTENRLWTHMLQHQGFLLVAAPLLAASSPGAAVLAGMPHAVRGRLVRVARGLRLPALNNALLAWAVSQAAMWAWHLPGPYDAAVRSEPVHLSEHATFLLTGWWFWSHVLGHRRLADLPAAGYVAAAMLPGSALGAVLTFPRHPLYPAQATLSRAAGIDPLLDQRLGGIAMWVPMDFFYVALAVFFFSRWMGSTQRSWTGQAPAQAPLDQEVVR